MAADSNKGQESLFIVNAKDKYICFPLEETVFIKQKITLLIQLLFFFFFSIDLAFVNSLQKDSLTVAVQKYWPSFYIWVLHMCWCFIVRVNKKSSPNAP